MESAAGKSMEERIAESYRQDEDMMILVFAQWCVNHGLDPAELYRKAYPSQPANDQLTRVLALTVPKEEAGEIPDQTLLGVLSLFGNEDLAIVVSEAVATFGADKK
ncbi:hypothetical protein PVOR_12735 [Paenibacillus vortex V453]|jgi:hypothetical protein|uniref:YxiS n=2 Tax=Paenibacillus TaxID=44249 RepID=A0A163LAD9_9BACL|nr:MULTISPECIES: hypothetical protein [Paenibacillus]ANA81901.1 hypothetical protein A3958_18870 [Paenibacillus glucanolyticus]AVV59366.1 hypothetical protein C7121_26180 [Paenibacillus glucanolyticus]AWP28548.1 hypothetical protein B9D94_18815 [Paenibacillus sp. Cedars]EFU41793.1 hypothetical protein PVOR_12735 [Paenibacillus vortex V453]ETT43326.1 hypothetical protein C169_01285 [Paenibacillus sp. FSL R5-808]